MPTLILLRHGRTKANATGTLAGRGAGVSLDQVGREQAEKAGARLAGLPLAHVVASPLERTLQTAAAVARQQADEPAVEKDRGLIECGYGAWTGRTIAELSKDPLWKVVQSHPSSVTFPEGEAMVDMQARAVSTVRRWDARVADTHGGDAVWVAVSHGDVIKSVLADALGMHLDSFQRIVVSPASVSVVSYGTSRPSVLHVNDHASDLAGLAPKPRKRRRPRASGDAVVGGGAG